MHNIVNVPNATKLFPLKWLILCKFHLNKKIEAKFFKSRGKNTEMNMRKSNTKEKRKEIQSIDYKFKKENSLLF